MHSGYTHPQLCADHQSISISVYVRLIKLLSASNSGGTASYTHTVTYFESFAWWMGTAYYSLQRPLGPGCWATWVIVACWCPKKAKSIVISMSSVVVHHRESACCSQLTRALNLRRPTHFAFSIHEIFRIASSSVSNNKTHPFLHSIIYKQIIVCCDSS